MTGEPATSTVLGSDSKLSAITKGRMLSIDALRGIAAFSVVIFHVFGSAPIFRERLAVGKLYGWSYLYFIPAYGYAGVYLFFVISGFCIHLRWARTKAQGENTKRAVDFFSFWKRRWTRLYPAYIAAILLYLIWDYYRGQLTLNSFFAWDLFSHLLMIHNLDNRTAYSMNNVFWTLAIEEQLYLLYFALLFIREKLGWGFTIAITFASRFVWLVVCVAVVRLSNFQLPFTEGALANWWIWTLGALAVENHYGLIKLPARSRSIPIAAVLFIIASASHFLGFASPATAFFTDFAYVLEPFLWGFGFFFLINAITSKEAALRGKRYNSVMFWAFIGIFSYSLYLTHEFVIQAFKSISSLFICLLSLVFAYGFFLLFEKPFMLYLARKSQTMKR